MQKYNHITRTSSQYQEYNYIIFPNPKIEKLLLMFTREKKGPHFMMPVTLLNESKKLKRPPMKRALLIGINYFNTSYELRGCISDVKNMRQFIIKKYNYSVSEMMFLTDEPSNQSTERYPNRVNIMKALKWLVTNVQAGDSLFLHYSGHGGLGVYLMNRRTLSLGDCLFDETLYPVDFKTAGPIVDNWLHGVMVKSLPANVKLTALFGIGWIQ